MQIDIEPNRVIIEGNVLMRPKHVCPSDWMRRWELLSNNGFLK